jgi:hypothetical protein
MVTVLAAPPAWAAEIGETVGVAPLADSDLGPGGWRGAARRRLHRHAIGWGIGAGSMAAVGVGFLVVGGISRATEPADGCYYDGCPGDFILMFSVAPFAAAAVPSLGVFPTIAILDRVVTRSPHGPVELRREFLAAGGVLMLAAGIAGTVGLVLTNLAAWSQAPIDYGLGLGFEVGALGLMEAGAATLTAAAELRRWVSKRERPQVSLSVGRAGLVVRF